MGKAVMTKLREVAGDLLLKVSRKRKCEFNHFACCQKLIKHSYGLEIKDSQAADWIWTQCTTQEGKHNIGTADRNS
jgi:hypothetical protein